MEKALSATSVQLMISNNIYMQSIKFSQFAKHFLPTVFAFLDWERLLPGGNVSEPTIRNEDDIEGDEDVAVCVWSIRMNSHTQWGIINQDF